MSLGTLGIIGYGNMGAAIVGGLVDAGIYAPVSVNVHDTDAGRRAEAAARGFTVHDTPAAVGSAADTVIIAVKPHGVAPVIGQLDGMPSGTLVISIAAGVPLGVLEGAAPHNPVIRVMPNTPCLVGAGANALARGAKADDTHVARAMTILGALGTVTEVPESLMDAVTGLSGSGPAYVALLIDAMTDGGVKMGIPRPAALALAAQTVYGAAKLLIERGLQPSQLRDMVTSPGGTTIEGVSVLEDGAFRSLVIGAVEAATRRSKELAG